MKRTKILLGIFGICGIGLVVLAVWLNLPTLTYVPQTQAEARENEISSINAVYRDKAEKGDARAQVKLGMVYLKWGRADEENYIEAYRWFQKAASQGSPEAFSALGAMYNNGLGVEMNKSEALVSYTLGLNQNDKDPTKRASNQYNIGMMYYLGENMPKDYEVALKYFTAAALAQNPNAEQQIGLMCIFGYGMQQNFDASASWLQKAAHDGKRSASRILKALEDSQVRSPPHDDKRVFALVKDLADQSYPEAQFELARMYFYGIGTAANTTEGARMLSLTATQGDVVAQYLLGSYCLKKPDACGGTMQTYKWLSLAAEQNYADADKLLAALKATMTPKQIEMGDELAQSFEPPKHVSSP